MTDPIGTDALLDRIEELEAELYAMTEDRNIVLETSQQQFIHIVELEARNTALGEAVAYATQRFTKAEVKLLSAMDTLQYYNVEVRTPKKDEHGLD